MWGKQLHRFIFTIALSDLSLSLSLSLSILISFGTRVLPSVSYHTRFRVLYKTENAKPPEAMLSNTACQHRTAKNASLRDTGLSVAPNLWPPDIRNFSPVDYTESFSSATVQQPAREVDELIDVWLTAGQAFADGHSSNDWTVVI